MLKTAIFDGNGVARMAFEAFKQLSVGVGSKRIGTGAVFGTFNRIIEVNKMFKCDKMVIAWDKGYKHRLLIDPTYKQPRRDKEWPERDEFYQQIELLQKILSVSGIPEFYCDGYEGDDVIATLVKSLPGERIVVSDDHDMFQCLIDDNVIIHRSRGDFSASGRMTRQSMEDKYGISADDWTLFQAIRGCPGDNVKGCKGIGDKNGMNIIQKYSKIIKLIIRGKLEPEKLVYGEINKTDLSENIKMKLKTSFDEIRIAHQLVTMKTNLKLTCKRNRLNLDKLVEALEELNCFETLDRLHLVEMWKEYEG